MTLLSVLLILLLVVFLLLTVILIIPVYYSGSGRWQDALTGCFWVKAGLVELQLDLAGAGQSLATLRLAGLNLSRQPLQRAEKKPAGKSPEKEKGRGSPASMSTFLDRDLIRALFSLIRKTVRALAPRTFEIKGVLGFEDPYYTGLLAALRSMVPGIDIEPDFTREVRDIALTLQGKIVLITVLFHVLRFLLSREGRIFIKKIRQQKKYRKNATGEASPVYR